jgi:diadenosine tetraphosphate (Ap4A) HIT family hydrolase
VPGSLGLLPSGPDPVGEWLVHHQPPEAHIGNIAIKSKPSLKKTASPWKTLEEYHLTDFVLDKRLEQDSTCIIQTGLCDMRLSKDARWPWLILVPRRQDITEIFELTPLDQVMLTFEIELVAKALKDVTGATKINVGSLGNIVRQLHVHVIARFEGDPGWPGPVWGFGKPETYEEAQQATLITRLQEALSS